jgi:acyl carrier protein
VRCLLNEEKYNQVFCEIFGLKLSDLGHELHYQSVPSWDSVGHLALISELETQFNISLEIDDVIEFSSYEKGKTILNRYGIELV